ELNRQLSFRSLPLLRRPFPLRRDVPQGEVDQLRRRLVTREMTLVPNRLADLTMQRFDRIRNRHDIADAPRPLPNGVRCDLPGQGHRGARQTWAGRSIR